ncbi:hypothetical protein KAJ27_13040 [bacterium]|nr:hypothetical protein [bacterium]
MKKFLILSLVMVMVFTNITIVSAFKIKNLLKDALKVEVARQSVKALAKPLNKFVNTLLMNNGVEAATMTKVVPILKAGINTKAEVGLAQVAGPADRLSRVKAVWEIDGRFGGNNRFAVKAFVPSSSMNPFKLNRINGVGISAIISGRL